MIEVNITGQLGNQLFQYACARQLQEIYGGEIILNTHELTNTMKSFNLSLMNFSLSDSVRIENQNPLKKINAERLSVKLFRKYIPNLYFYIKVRQGAFIWGYSRIYKELPLLKKNTDYIELNGFWQCEKYFDAIPEIIKKEFTPKYPKLESNEMLYQMIKKTNSVCVTVRRGDFLSSNHINTFYVCDSDYFQNAMVQMKKLVPRCVFFAFSDDIEWVKQNVAFPGKVYYESGNDPVWEKLRLMYCCKHFILSNSSFSWWAQHLSENDNKIVIAPDRWYNSGKNQKAAIYSDQWEIVNAKK
ncbi:MAG: alpha-1,2-fucosyltransferase [Bacilli bacterium]|uniref:alpha-1,2-fucosyltransferase n=1 Tax=Anaerorhabdus sp. TaxID=1872524 RepID=UPI002FC72544